MEIFYLLCLIPVTIAFGAKFRFQHTITWGEMAVQAIAGIIIVAIIHFTGIASATSDTEIWNGQITGKDRDHGHYVESYSCNCRSVKVGKTTTRSCQTCYRDHYTVTWTLNSTIGNIQVGHRDSTWRSVYSTPDPKVYSQAKIGEHCSREVGYTNYVKAVPQSLFHAVGINDGKVAVPEYPSVYDIYKVNRVIGVGIKRDALMNDLNTALNDQLKTLGRKRQVNINVIIANSSSTKFKDAVEHDWVGGKKNDVNVVINAPNYPKIETVQVFTFARTSGNNLVAINIRDQLQALGTLEQPTAVANLIATNVDKHYKRKDMKDFEYLKNQIEPPTWVIVLGVILSILFGCGLTYFFHTNDTVGRDYHRTRRSQFKFR